MSSHMLAGVMQAGLVPNSYVGMGNDGTGCFAKGTDVTLGKPDSAVTPV